MRFSILRPPSLLESEDPFQGSAAGERADPAAVRRPTSQSELPLAATNKCLAQGNKSGAGGKATKKRESSVFATGEQR